ncbi:hypothetical protein L1887_02360 [Cichorium endivia]|nr:hypothetical protein L1887_02360 [Cichorium endivia]
MSTGSNQSTNQRNPPLQACQAMCKCKPPFPIVECESLSDANPARKFKNYCLSLISLDACNFFDWVDPTVNKHYKKTLLRLKARSNGVELVNTEIKLAAMEADLSKE